MARIPSQIDVSLDDAGRRAIGRYSVTVSVRGRISPAMRVRLWLAVRLIRAAQWVVGLPRAERGDDAS